MSEDTGSPTACGAAGPPVVLLHGTPSFFYIWRDVAPEIANAGFQVLTFDLLGFGFSERPGSPEVDTSVAGQVPVLLSLLEKTGTGPAHVVAQDIGAAIAMRFARDHPEHVQSLTLIDSVSFDSWPSKRTREQIAGGLDALRSADDATLRAHFADWLSSAVVNREAFRDGALPVYLDMISGPVGQGSLVQHQIRHYDGAYTGELTPRRQELQRYPVQLIWGAEDVWQNPDWGRRLRSAIPGATFEMLEDCGHFAMEDRPDAVSEQITGFLTSVAGLTDERRGWK